MKRGQKMVVCQDTETSRPPEAREAVTSYRVIETIGVGQDQISRVTLHPRTGRMHQLRVQMATLGCPIVGDRVYGQGDRTPLRLHAERVCVAHPETGKKIEFYSKPLF